MGIKHKITIHVSDPKGKSKTILKGANMKLPARIVRLLFGDYQQIYLLSPGQWVCHKPYLCGETMLHH